MTKQFRLQQNIMSMIKEYATVRYDYEDNSQECSNSRQYIRGMIYMYNELYPDLCISFMNEGTEIVVTEYQHEWGKEVKNEVFRYSVQQAIDDNLI